MEDLNPVPAWDPSAPIPSTWEDMLNHLLQEPEAIGVGDGQVQLEDEGSLVDSYFGDITGLGEVPNSETWWAALPSDPVLDQIDLHELDNSFIGEETVSLPGLSSEISSPASNLCVLDEPKAGREIPDGGVSSPVSCNKFEEDTPSPNSGDEVGNGSSRLHSPVVTSCSDHGAASPDAGCDSSDVGAFGRSCDNFAEQSKRMSDRTPAEIDEDSKRQSRLMRNRESAVQSRQRKKSYVKELEAKCRAMESQMSMLHQTVAFTSAQNAALREELAHYRGLKGNGSKSGVMEPAALPSDSLPSESPSHHTTLFPSVKLELVAFLCHVLLLTLLQVLPLKPATSEGKPPSKARSERRQGSVAANQFERDSEAVKQLRNRLCSSNRRRKRTALTKDRILRCSVNSSMMSATSKLGLPIGENSSTECRISSKRSLKRLSRRSQYSSLG